MVETKEYTKQQGTFLKAKDVNEKPTALWEIIAEGDFVKSEKFNILKLHLPIKNGEEERIFDCSKTNARFIETALKSSDTRKWIGKMLLLETYKTKTSDGKLTEAINVKEVK